MKLTQTALTVIAVWMLGLGASVQAQDATGPAPVEAFFCNYQAGKNMDDLVKVANKFSKWADKNDADYSAWLLTPRFGILSELPHVVWLGSNPNGNSMGQGLDAWVKSGDDLQAEFNSVIACGGHGLASSTDILAPDGPPDDGVVMFMQCELEDDNGWMKAVEAHKQFAKAMRDLGAKNSNWLFYPMLGGAADRGFDYWGVSTFKNWSDFFAAYELYVTGGGWQKQMELMDDVADCNPGTPTVWDVKLVRKAAP